MKRLADMLDAPPLTAYTYSYPHKTAHRPLDPPVALRDLWSAEDRRSLFLYLHVPFCPRRCGYCNLFSLALPQEPLVRRWLDAVERHAERVCLALDGAQFAQIAIGGGTPTLLDLPDLDRLLRVAERIREDAAGKVPVSVEVSPSTVSKEKLMRLKQFGATRLSIGVQTFDPKEASLLDRPQSAELLDRALQTIREVNFPVLNIDLMYGLPGQTLDSWRRSILAVLSWRPEEIFLYPLYTRPLTRLASHSQQQEDWRGSAYREARDSLLDEGYAQASMRMFRASHAPQQDSPLYRCQDDGMVGIGCGARSYTRTLHYSTPYAVSPRNVADLIEQYAVRTTESFDWADYGFRLDAEDQKRRYALLSLLEHDGLAVTAYAARFGSHPLTDLPELQPLVELGLVNVSSDIFRLTERGMEQSDAIGPWLYSNKVRRLMEAYSPC